MVLKNIGQTWNIFWKKKREQKNKIKGNSYTGCVTGIDEEMEDEPDEGISSVEWVKSSRLDPM